MTAVQKDESLLPRYKACLVLAGVGDAMGYRVSSSIHIFDHQRMAIGSLTSLGSTSTDKLKSWED